MRIYSASWFWLATEQRRAERKFLYTVKNKDERGGSTNDERDLFGKFANEGEKCTAIFR